MMDKKPVHTVVLDAGPLLLNQPPISTLLSSSEQLYTTSAVIAEIKDRNARSRLEHTVIPFLTVRDPAPASVRLVSDFARRTGDLAVLSRPDIQVLALAYELECEGNHGDWRLRKVPGQKGLNGTPPKQQGTDGSPPEKKEHHAEVADSLQVKPAEGPEPVTAGPGNNEADNEEMPHERMVDSTPSLDSQEISKDLASSISIAPVCIDAHVEPETASTPPREEDDDAAAEESDSEGWITPSNLKSHQAKDAVPFSSASAAATPSPMLVATITGDFAMQNVLLQMNMNLLSSSLRRIRYLKTYILRCHACFATTKEMTKQFCPRCGKPSLTRVSCSNNADGTFSLHLKKNFQYNTRGDRYSIPKPVSGSANGKVGQGKGGGKGGWGQELILTEDQKEYIAAVKGQARKKERNLMDDDYLPGILTGERSGSGGRPKIGAGRTINSRKH